jgi:hypothetical protein
MLLLYYVCAKHIKERVWWGPTTRVYRRVRQALITGNRCEELPPAGIHGPVRYLKGLADLINGHYESPSDSLDLYEPENALQVLQGLTQYLLDYIDVNREFICDRIAERMQRYLLGYATLEETLPEL